MRVKKNFGQKRKRSLQNINKRKRINFKVWLGFGLWGLIIGSIVIFGGKFLVTSKFGIVEQITVEGNNFLTQEQIINFLRENFDNQTGIQKYRANLVFISQNRIKNILTKKYPIIVEVYTNKKFPNTLEVSLKEREIGFDTCNQNGVCYLVAKDGVVVAEGMSDQFVDFKTIFEPVLENNIVSSREAKWLNSIIILSKDVLAQEVVKLEVTEVLEDNIKELKIFVPEGYYLWVNDEIDIAKQFYAVQQLFAQNLSIEKRQALEYIDIRIPNKIFYKSK